jgi:tetrahydromethanopterin S-methyltransferase subunit C
MDGIWIALIIGLVVGAVFSVVFGVVSKKGSDDISRNFLGMSSSVLVTDAIIIVIIGSFVFLSTLSAIVKDLAYPRAKPINFTVETLLMAFMPASIIFVMTYLRGFPIELKTWEEFGILSVKFGLLHILLQFSGFYSYAFS